MVIEIDTENFLFDKVAFNLSNKFKFISLCSIIVEIEFFLLPPFFFRHTVYLSDAFRPISVFGGIAVAVSSPKEKETSFAKKAIILYLPTWTFAEISDANSLAYK